MGACTSKQNVVIDDNPPISDPNCPGPTLSCVSVQRITKLLETSTLNNIQLNDDYNCSDLLNDFIHLLHDHNSNDAFETILNNINLKCDILKCEYMRRNNRDRLKTNNDNIYKTDNQNDQIIQQIFDKIHCYFIHQIDLGFRLTKKDHQLIQNIRNMHNNNNDIQIQNSDLNDNKNSRNQRNIDPKNDQTDDVKSDYKNDPDDDNDDLDFDPHNPYDNIELKQANSIISSRRAALNKSVIRLDRPNKFQLNVSLKKEKLDNDAGSILVYSFGFEYEYTKYKQNHQWYIKKKYNDLKDEFMNNDIEPMPIKSYNNLQLKAANHHNSSHCKSITNILTLNLITMHHIMSIMTYCCFTEMQKRLTETYRYLNANESENDLKKRHSSFGNWGHLLKDAVQNYGTEIKKGKYKKFYHGINREMYFESTISHFFSPLSTSSAIEVALGFATNSGLILELQQCGYGHLEYFDCAWLSDYGYEMEKFFIGGNEPLRTHSIIQPKINANYQTFVESLNIIQSLFDGEYYYTPGNVKPFKPSIKKRFIKVITNEMNRYIPSKYKKYKKLPKYMNNLVNYYFLHKRLIKIDWHSLGDPKENQDRKGYLFCRHLFVDMKDEKWLNVPVLSVLFPNVYEISVSNLLLCEEVFECIINYITTYQQNNNNNNNDDDNKDDNKDDDDDKNDDIMNDVYNYLINQVDNAKNLRKIKKFLIYRPNRFSTITVQAGVEKYDKEFKKIGWEMSVNGKILSIHAGSDLSTLDQPISSNHVDRWSVLRPDELK